MSIGEQFFLLLISYIANTFSAFAGGGAGLIQLPMLLFLACHSVLPWRLIKWPVLLLASGQRSGIYAPVS